MDLELFKEVILNVSLYYSQLLRFHVSLWDNHHGVKWPTGSTWH